MIPTEIQLQEINPDLSQVTLGTVAQERLLQALQDSPVGSINLRFSMEAGGGKVRYQNIPGVSWIVRGASDVESVAKMVSAISALLQVVQRRGLDWTVDMLLKASRV